MNKWEEKGNMADFSFCSAECRIHNKLRSITWQGGSKYRASVYFPEIPGPITKEFDCLHEAKDWCEQVAKTGKADLKGGDNE